MKYAYTRYLFLLLNLCNKRSFCGSTSYLYCHPLFAIAVIYSICQDFDIDFPAMYACVGLWNSFFLFLYSAFDLSVLMKWSTR